MDIGFFESILRGEMRKGVERERKIVRLDPFEELVCSLEFRRNLNREELEGLVKGLDVREEDVDKYCAGNENKVARKVSAKNGLLECAVCGWPPVADVFSIVQGRGSEVLRVWSGKILLTEYYYVRGRMEPYCVAELNSGSVVGLPPAVVYRMENKGKGVLRTLHFLSPPPKSLPSSEGIRNFCGHGDVSIV